MIRSLCAKLYLTQQASRVTGSLTDGLGKQLVRHKMGTGATRQISAVP